MNTNNDFHEPLHHKFRIPFGGESPETLSAVELPPRPTPVHDPMEELARLISKPPAVPKIGLMASGSMRKCFETVIEDVDRLVREHVERATALQQEAETFTAVIREAGEKLCARIEQEAVRGCQVSQVMRAAREMIETVIPPDSVQ